ncbi:YtpI family protein [Paenibacillus doosanensis]|uniref:YtpI family protein n=1 Tax=Paenibacillus doosanensis TaxID=1229154 RepID=UPI00217FC918|nr:YtpI family protein [Paenibacillus doosanensis]MCS7463618.1 YtpI family protein [Paenibacillus doosanensis]
METTQLILPVLIVITLAVSVFYSFRSRRSQDPKLRGLYASRMNIAMGLMLIVIAITQLFFFTDSNTRRIFGIVCFLLGMFNLFAGLRNHSIYSKQ